MKLRLIACRALKDEIKELVEQGSIDADVVFLDMTLHNNYDLLERKLKSTIEESIRDYSKTIVLIYGDLCLGTNGEMKRLANSYGIVNIDASNCIDCLFGGKGKIFEIDPEQTCLFLSPGMIKLWNLSKRGYYRNEEFKKLFGELKGIILLDTLGNLDDHKVEIEEFASYTGLPILEKKSIGLTNFREVVLEAIKRLNDQKEQALIR